MNNKCLISVNVSVCSLLVTNNTLYEIFIKKDVLWGMLIIIVVVVLGTQHALDHFQMTKQGSQRLTGTQNSFIYLLLRSCLISFRRGPGLLTNSDIKKIFFF